MSRLSKNARLTLGALVVINGGIILILFIRMGLFQQSFPWEMIWTGLAGGASTGLGVMARTRPRLRAALWAGGWAVVVAGFTWIITEAVSERFVGTALRAETLIPPLITALITFGGVFWSYWQHLPAQLDHDKEAPK
jgi:hypothetical protein